MIKNWSWFRKGSKSPSPVPATRAAADDPEMLLNAFKSHWVQASSIIGKHIHVGADVFGDDVVAIFNHLNQMVELLVTEVNIHPTDRSIGPVLDFIFTEEVFEKILDWSLSTGSYVDTCKLNQLKLYEVLLIHAQQPLLVHKPVLLPLLRLLEECCRAPHAEVEKHFIVLLNQICVSISQSPDASLLEFFFSNNSEDGLPKFSVFTLLIPYLYCDGNVGQLARDACLLILSVSTNVESVGRFIAEHSSFCPLLAAGLCGLYSMLPRTLPFVSEDWHQITTFDIDAIPALHAFHSALGFCNAVVQVSHRYVQEQLLDYIYQGFLVPVISSVLHESSEEEQLAATAYFELCFRCITEPALMRIFLKFLLIERRDGVPVIEVLVSQISSSSKLAVVSLSLMSTLLSLHCEDFMFELVLKYLIPCTHIMPSDAPSINDFEIHGGFAERLISLMPSCCSTKFYSSAFGSATTSFNSSSDFVNETEENGSGSGTGTGSGSIQSAEDLMRKENDSFMQKYLGYSLDARKKLRHSYRSCRLWAFPYDGANPDPNHFREPDSRKSSPDPDPDMNPDANSEGSFRRQKSFRQSIRNAYFSSKRMSNLVQPSNLSKADLELGDYLNTYETLVEEFEDELEEDSKQKTAAGAAAAAATESSSSSSEPSTPSVRRRCEMTSAIPPDYFKLAFEFDDDPISIQSPTASDVESSRADPYMLTGWKEIKDLDTFLEILDRVRPSLKSVRQSMNENAEAIENIFSKMIVEISK